MHSLPTFIAGFSISVAAFSMDNLDNSYAVNLPTLDLPLPDSLNPTTPGNEPISFLVNFDTTPFETLDNPESVTFSPTIAQGPSANRAGLDIVPFATPDIPESSTFSLKLAQVPSVNGARASSIDHPLTHYTEAQIHTDDSNGICYGDSDTGQKGQAKLPCSKNTLLSIPSPRLPNIDPNLPRTEEQRRNDERFFRDEQWSDNLTDEDEKKVKGIYIQGEEACKKQGSGGEEPVVLCCVGPEERFTVPTLGQRRVRRNITITNVFNCLYYLLPRPFCLGPVKIYCCVKVDFIIVTDWGWKGLDCTQLLSPPPHPDPDHDELSVPIDDDFLDSG